jgi:hypothetical protein
MHPDGKSPHSDVYILMRILTSECRRGMQSDMITDIICKMAPLADTQIEVALEISVESPNGFPEKTRRDVTENCRTSNFNTFGFEEE